MMNITPVVKQLLIINIIFFIGSQFVEVADSLFALSYFENPMFKFWQPITHMFMHANVMHIFFNMFALYSFGSTLEHFWGGKKFIFFYISCGLGAALLHSAVNYYQFHQGLDALIQSGTDKSSIIDLLNKGRYDTRWVDTLGASDLNSFLSGYNTKALGASGAVYGLLVAFAFMFPNAELALMFIPIPIKAKYFVPIWMLLYDGLFGILGNSFVGIGSDVAHFAHIGGAITGFIMMWFWKKNQFNKNRWN